jgi:hypothetical protein
MIAGIALVVLGVVAYTIQLYFQLLILPWYVPAAAVLGVVLVAASLRKRRTVWRWLALGMVMLLAGLELLALYAVRLPPYTGPVAVGYPLSVFEVRRADGTPFTQNDLVGDQHQALVFFRGRW